MNTQHHVEIDLNTLLELVNEVAKEDPLDYGNLPVDERVLRRTCCMGALHILEHAANFKADELMYVMLSAMAKLIEENVLLHAQSVERGEKIRSEMVQQILNKAMKGGQG